MRRGNIKKRRSLVKDILLADPYLRYDPETVRDTLVDKDLKSFAVIKLETVKTDIKVVLRGDVEGSGPSPLLMEIIALGRLWRAWEANADRYNEAETERAKKETRKAKNETWEAVRHHWDRLNLIMEQEPYDGTKGTPGTITNLIQTDRRNRLKNLIPYERDITRIAQALQVSISTVQRDLQAIKTEGLSVFERLSVDDIFDRYVRETNMEDRTLVKIIEDKEYDMDLKIKAIRERKDTRRDVIQVGQDLGIIPKTADTLNINLTYEERKSLVITFLEKITVPIIEEYIEDPVKAIEASKKTDERVRIMLEDGNSKTNNSSQ